MSVVAVIAIIVIAIIIIAIYKYKISSSIEGLYTFNGRMGVDYQYFYDKLFMDTYYFPNRYDQPYKTGEEIGRLIETGYDHCCRVCSGSCVEYGVMGDAYCFINRLYSI
jgi:hypothetical protein